MSCFCVIFVFFFKQKTAYEMRISDWSSDVCSSDLITGPLLAYEVLTAFFLEAGFLGVMLFGWKRVGLGLHFFATIMVALGTLLSATWILASNSWMQTPAGYEIVNNQAIGRASGRERVCHYV